MIESFRMSCSGYGRETEMNFASGAGRIYVTSPTFGVDLSVDWVSGTFGFKDERDPFDDYFHGGPVYSRVYARSHVLTLEFGLPSLSLHLPTKTEGVLQVPDPSKPFLLLDTRKDEPPPEPLNPLWLPKGVWCCSWCTTAQEPHLLQCRNCGAPRIGVPYGT